MTPIDLHQWAMRHAVSHTAMHELRGLMGMHGGHTMPEKATGTSEAAVSNVVRMEAARKGVKLFRNNVGALIDTRGVPVRFGLANDSPAINKVLKSSDLIGWRPVLIGHEHLGLVLGLTVMRETKRVGWHYTGSEREQAQLNWLSLAVAGGCDASFCTGEGSF